MSDGAALGSLPQVPQVMGHHFLALGHFLQRSPGTFATHVQFSIFCLKKCTLNVFVESLHPSGESGYRKQSEWQEFGQLALTIALLHRLCGFFLVAHAHDLGLGPPGIRNLPLISTQSSAAIMMRFCSSIIICTLLLTFILL